MNRTRLTFVLALPVVALVHSFGMYLARGQWWAAARDAGAPAGQMYNVAAAAGILGAVVAAMVGAIGGGPACLTLGLLGSAAGELLMAADWTSPGSVAVGVGRTLTMVGGATCALRAFPPRGDSGRMALLIAVYAAANVASMAASPAGSLLSNLLGARAAIAAGGAIELVAALLSAPLLYLAFVRPPEGAGGGALHPGLLALGVGVATVGSAAAGTLWLGTTFSYESHQGDTISSAWLELLNPIGVLASSVLCGGLLVLLAVQRRQAPPLLVAGLGLFLGGLVLLPTAEPGARGDVAQAAITFASGLGEPLLFAGVLAGAAGGLHWRVAPALVAVFSVLQTLPQWLWAQAAGRLGVDTPGAAGAAGCGAIVMLTGVAFLIAAIPVGWLRAALLGSEEDDARPDEGLDPYGFPAPQGPGAVRGP